MGLAVTAKSRRHSVWEVRHFFGVRQRKRTGPEQYSGGNVPRPASFSPHADEIDPDPFCDIGSSWRGPCRGAAYTGNADGRDRRSETAAWDGEEEWR